MGQKSERVVDIGNYLSVLCCRLRLHRGVSPYGPTVHDEDEDNGAEEAVEGSELNRIFCILSRSHRNNLITTVNLSLAKSQDRLAKWIIGLHIEKLVSLS